MTLAWALKGLTTYKTWSLPFLNLFGLALIFLLMTSTESGVLIYLSCTCPPVEAGGGKEKGPGEGTFVDWLELLTLWGLGGPSLLPLVLSFTAEALLATGAFYGGPIHSSHCRLLTLRHSLFREGICSLLAWPVTQ